MSNNMDEKRRKTVATRMPVEIVRATCRAADEIVTESRNYSLGEVSIRELLDEGRRG